MTIPRHSGDVAEAWAAPFPEVSSPGELADTLPRSVRNSRFRARFRGRLAQGGAPSI